MTWIKTLPTVAKAIAGAAVGVATYIIASDIVLDDPKWWAAGIIFLGAGHGIVWVIPNR